MEGRICISVTPDCAEGSGPSGVTEAEIPAMRGKESLSQSWLEPLAAGFWASVSPSVEWGSSLSALCILEGRRSMGCQSGKGKGPVSTEGAVGGRCVQRGPPLASWLEEGRTPTTRDLFSGEGSEWVFWTRSFGDLIPAHAQPQLWV